MSAREASADELRAALAAVLAGEELERARARSLFAAAFAGDADPVALGGLLVALAARGEGAALVAGVAVALRAAALPFEHDAPEAIDTCGTGGDGAGTFNLSTAAALVACAAGARVIKHGGRSVSSSCGSADLLEAAGLSLELAPAAAREVLERCGITFLFAPRYHPAMRAAAPVRRALGVRTVLNLVGPLCNPGRVRRQLVGVGEPRYLAPIALALGELGHARALVVHGAGGADELTLAGENRLARVGDAPDERFDASALGLAPAPLAALRGGDAAANLALLRALLAGERSPLADAVALNAAAALVVAGVAQTAAEGLERARSALAGGAAAEKLDEWIACARRAARRPEARA